MASPAEADNVSASATSIRSRVRPLLAQRLRYVARVAGDSLVDSILSMSCRSRLSKRRSGPCRPETELRKQLERQSGLPAVIPNVGCGPTLKAPAQFAEQEW
eukprot:6173494-Pleurochrysis_carterae.AAC.1